MAFTHVDIEERAGWRLLALFAALTLIYGASTLLLLVVIAWGFGMSWLADGTVLPAALCAALIFALLHWSVSTSQLMARSLASLAALPPDPEDRYHQRFINIVEEARVATGGLYSIEPHVINNGSVNACSVTDFDRRGSVVVTEGLLARLSRPQLEAVVAYAVSQIVSGDGLLSSVFTSLFGLHQEALRLMLESGDGEGPRIRASGRSGAVIAVLFVVLLLTEIAKRCCEAFISRNQVLRADALAVKLTRNPLALAEALHLIQSHWRGNGVRGASLTALFIVEPGEDARWDAREDAWASLITTHPPTQERMELLCALGGMDPERLEQSLKERAPKRVPRGEGQPPAALPRHDGNQWFLFNGESWDGPFDAESLLERPGAGPQSWVRFGEAGAGPLYRQGALMDAYRKRLGQPADLASTRDFKTCPRCGVGLAKRGYEGASIEECPACRGCYVKRTTVERLIAREEYTLPEEAKRAAAALDDLENAMRVRKAFQAENRWKKAWACPECGSAMARKFYTEVYLVEVEQCWVCGTTWFDRMELEILQCLFESRKGAQWEDEIWKD